MFGRYDKQGDWFEFMLPHTENEGDTINKYLTLFRLKSDDSIIGFELRHASMNYDQLIHIPLKFRIAGLLCLARNIEGLTQTELAEKAGLGVNTIKRAESTKEESTLSLESLNKIIAVLPDYDWSILIRPYEPEKETA